MARFYVRVELHGGTWLDYLTLHANMAAEGFGRTVESGGENHRLPSGEYTAETDATPDDVYAAACRAASVTAGSFDMRVTMSADSRFLLRPVGRKRPGRAVPAWAT
jgi:hypothetical protein